MTRRLADRVTRSEPARGPLQLHHLDAKTEICCERCGQRSQTRVVATVEQNWARLVDCGCYDTWTGQLDTGASTPELPALAHHRRPARSSRRVAAARPPRLIWPR